MSNQANKPLTESRVTKIVTSIPEVKDRAAMFTHLSLVKAWGTPAGCAAPEMRVPSDEELKRVLDYIRRTNEKDTVRAKYARKIADQLEAGSHRE